MNTHVEQRWHLLLTLLIVLIVAFVGLNNPLFDLDEGAFSEATRELIRSGNYISTTLNGLPRYDKPILVYWLQAASVLSFGPENFAFRLPSVLMSLVWFGATFAFARRHFGKTAGLLAAGLLAAAIGPGLIAKAATADALLNTLIALTAFALYEHLSSGRRVWRLVAAACVGFGLLAKGPIAVLVPGVTLLLFCLQQRRLADLGRILVDPWAWIIMLGIALPWYIAIYLRDGQAFIDGFIMRHNVDRFRSPMESHGGALFYYIPVGFLLLLPASGAFAGLFQQRRELGKSSVGIFLLIWFVFVLVFFSLSGTKLPHYLNYGLTPIVILLAAAISKGAGRNGLLVGLILPALCAILPFALDHLTGIGPYYLALMPSAKVAFGQSWLFCSVYVFIATFIIWCLRRISVSTAYLLVALVQTIFVHGLVMPTVSNWQQGPVVAAAEYCKTHGISEVVMDGVNLPSLAVYLGHSTPRRQPLPGEVVLTRIDHPLVQPGLVLWQDGPLMLLRAN